MARAALLAGALAAAAAAPSLSCGASLCFASGLSTGAVLQRAPSAAVLYGSAPPGSAGARVTLALNATDGSYGKVFSGAVAADGTWRVVLDARPAGGDYAATVACAACAGGSAAATIRDLTFGDVWFCGGQSNMSA
jgi:sialate O-acetylesterase